MRPLRNRWNALSLEMRRYLIVGVAVYLFELAVIGGAQLAGAGNLLAVGLGFWLGLLVSFGLQKVVAFGDTRTHHKVLVPQFLAFCLLVLFNFGFTLAVTAVLGKVMPVVICRSLALGTTTLWNFYLYKTRLFKQDPEVIG